MAKNPVGYSKRTLRVLEKSTVIDTEMESVIAESVVGTREMRLQMRRVFDAANKRIKRLDSSDEMSPALMSLGSNKHFGIGSHKTNSGDDWKALKKEYAKAVAFMRQPTSLLSGAREFTEHVKDELGVDDNLWESIHDSLGQHFDAIGSVFNVPYASVVQDIYRESISETYNIIENMAMIEEQQLESSVNLYAQRLANETEGEFNESDFIPLIMSKLLEGMNRLS